MKVYDLDPKDVVIGMIIKSHISDREGMIIAMDHARDSKYTYASILWDGDRISIDGFYGKSSNYEVLRDSDFLNRNPASNILMAIIRLLKKSFHPYMIDTFEV